MDHANAYDCLAGFSPATNDAVQGVPVGLELMGRDGEDERLLDLAESMEGVIQGRKVPSLLND